MDKPSLPLSRGQVLAGCAATIHLLLVLLGATYVSIPEHLPGRFLLSYYGMMSGADSSYGFFAPSIGARIRGVFDIVGRDGSLRTNVSLAPHQGREASIRFNGVIDEFIQERGEDPGFRTLLARSLAAAVFTEYPEAQQVVLHLEEYNPLPMEAYRQGKRASWEEIYRARFVRSEGASL